MVQKPESASFTLAASPAPPAPLTPPQTPPQTPPLTGPPSDQTSDSIPESQAAPPQQPVPRWLQRMELFLRVVLRFCIGFVLCSAPWTRALWDQNPVFLQYSWLGSLAASGAVRGLVTGLGLLNLWIAFQDAMRHQDG